MATGKELVRTLECGIWSEQIATRQDFVSAIIYDPDGCALTSEQAKERTFCHLKVIFKAIPSDSAQLIATLLKLISSTTSEHIDSDIHEYYGFAEIIIC